MRNLLLFFLFFTCCVLLSQAQIANSYTLKGYVADQQTGVPLTAATITILSADKEVIAGGASTGDGLFEIKNIPEGVYKLKISYLGYKSYKDSLHFTSKKYIMNIGRIELKPGSEKLKEIDIMAEKDQLDMVTDIDKKVYYADNNLIGSGASVLAMLRTLPAINVEVNGKISLRGSRGVAVYIDGRPSGLSGSGRQAVLEGIPVTAIERIEVITNPSAKYDADGASGIINIVMKKTAGLGTNLSISGSVGTREKGMLSGFFSHDNRKIQVMINLNYKYSNLFDNGDSKKDIFNINPGFTIRQWRNGLEKGGNYLANGSFLYRISTLTSLQAKGSFRYTYNTDLQTMTQEQRAQDQTLQALFARHTTKAQNEINYDLDLNFVKKFKRKNTKLTVDLSYSRNDETEHIDYETPRYYQIPTWINFFPTLRHVDGVPRTGIFMGRTDFEYQIKKKMNIELGLKANIRHNDEGFRSEDFDYSTNTWSDLQGISNRFIYHEEVFAGYFLFGHEIKRFSYKAGVRLEQAFINTDQVTLGQKNRRGYFQVYPSIHMGYKISEVSDLRLSYTRRVNRPNANNLNPFPDFSNPLSIRFGNQLLNPEYANNSEFSYSYKKGNHSFTTSAYFKYVTGVIGRYNTLDANGVSNITYDNLNDAWSCGLEFSSKNDFYPWWNMVSSANLFYFKVNASNIQNDLNNSSIGALVKMMHSFKFLKTFQIQWSSVFLSPQATAQSITKPRFYTDIAVRKDFFKNKLSLIFVLSDVLNTNQTFTDTRGLGFTNSSRRKVESRIAMLTITWRWGSNSKNKKQILEDDVNDLDPDD